MTRFSAYSLFAKALGGHTGAQETGSESDTRGEG